MELATSSAAPVGRLERLQLLAYLGALAAGLALGARLPAAGDALGALVLPALAALLFVTFLLVPLARIPDAVRDARFLLTALVANFVLVPLLVAGLVLLVPERVAGVDGALIVLGVVLVLVVPCTDWFLTFTQLAGGDTVRAVTFAPVSLVVQLMLLPVYVWAIAGADAVVRFEPSALATTAGVLLGPLLVAALVQLVRRRRDARRERGGTVAARGSRRPQPVDPAGDATARRPDPADRAGAAAARLPIPLLAVVLFAIAASELAAVVDAAPLLPLLVGVFALYLLAAVALGVVAARVARLPAAPARTLVMSLATRNSFVVLPIALALPEGAAVVAIVVVTQTLVELTGVALLVRVLPRIVR
ncbi:MAG TPA: arsenic resistance protein [Agrococcus sp.]|nr:arsenic resistance protein [Agrococcus sp.]